jgi:hypothetical protein
MVYEFSFITFRVYNAFRHEFTFITFCVYNALNAIDTCFCFFKTTNNFITLVFNFSVAFKLSRRTVDDNLKLLHTILFNRRAKVYPTSCTI